MPTWLHGCTQAEVRIDKRMLEIWIEKTRSHILI